MSIESSSSVPSDYPTEPPVGFRDLGSIDKKIAELSSGIFSGMLKFFISDRKVDSLNQYRKVVISFNKDLETWCNEKNEPPEYNSRLEACKRILACYTKGSKDLSLKGLGLTSLPESLSHLKELEQLDLSENNFTKPLNTLSSLSNLHRIEIDEHQRDLCPISLNKKIDVFSDASTIYKDAFITQPPEMLFNQFSKLSLEELYTLGQTSKHFKWLIDNYLENPSGNPKLTWKAPNGFDISKIQKSPTTLSRRIIDLDLSNVKGLTLEGLGDFLAFFPNITNIKLPNTITNEHLAHLTPLKQLKHLNLNRCSLITDAGLPHLASLKQLKHLNLSGCEQITDAGLPHLASLTQLQHLELMGYDQITDTGLAHLASLTQLQHLELRHCKQINGAGLARLASLKQLKHLNLSGCEQITDAGLAHLASLTQLKHLDLTWCLRITDAGLPHLASLTQLQHLNLSGCGQITDAGLAHLASLTQLQHLELRHCRQINGAGLAHLASLTQLKHLDLTSCLRITDAGLARLASLKQLKHLKLILCLQITDTGLAHLASLTQLQHLNLSSCNHITDAGLAQLARLTRLEHLDLTWCGQITKAAKQDFRTNHPNCLVD